MCLNIFILLFILSWGKSYLFREENIKRKKVLFWGVILLERKEETFVLGKKKKTPRIGQLNWGRTWRIFQKEIVGNGTVGSA